MGSRKNTVPNNLRGRHVAQLTALTTIGSDGCWTFGGYILPTGYGQIGRNIGAHRLAYQLAHGPIPEGLQIDHNCHNRDLSCPGGPCRHRRCVNPDHLEAVTTVENVMRGRGFGPANAAKTTCAAGHEFTPGNTYVTPKGKRVCIACRRAQQFAAYPDRAVEAVVYANAWRRRTSPEGYTIRAWARRNGLDVKDFGPIPAGVKRAYALSADSDLDLIAEAVTR